MRHIHIALVPEVLQCTLFSKKIYKPWERWSLGQGDLPHLRVGSRVTPDALLMKEGQTSPPLPISEPELIG
jgi:DNA topoisomerase IA